MLDNLPIKTLTHKDLTIEGYSRAAVQSYWRIPELKIGFDMGGSPWSFMGTQTFLITHAHLDHMAALPAYVARRKMMKMEPPTIYVPESVADSVDKMLRSWQKLDRGRMLCTIVPAADNGEYELSREHVITTFPTKHTVPSVGYIVWERRRKLKPEYSHLTGDQIRDLRFTGIDVSAEFRIPLVCYTGDTAPGGLDVCEAAYEAKILITEMTFFRPEHRKEKIHKFGHMHLDDIVARAERFKNELIILGHFSTRYHDDQIRKSVLKKLPESMRDRVELWL
ncbi:MBL fold metallo-hydrolase [Planctomicrobium sp. SH527]|uniref:MBL fold metallo-hydrolase n=1 Tax=Planctomicrobium sp. SH527 TaxID=3448123 RepID=UPI003F5C803C